MFWRRVGLHFVQILSVLQDLFIFKPDTIIIIYQLEFSGTRVKYLDHEKRAYQHEIWSYGISEKALIIAHFGMSRETRCLKVVWSLLQLAYFVYERMESPGKVMPTCRLVRAFTKRPCDNKHHLLC